MATDDFGSDDFGSKGPGLSYGEEGVGGLPDDAAAAVVEVTGVIKWFDVAKGYGFIVPDNGMPDVLLHVTCLRRDGFQTAYEGARIVCEAICYHTTRTVAFVRATATEADGGEATPVASAVGAFTFEKRGAAQ